MTADSGPEKFRPADLKLDVPVDYVEQEHWIIVRTGGGEARVVKLEPTRLQYDELALKLVVRVPMRRKKLAQTVVLTLPEETAHVAKIEASVPSA